MQFSRFSDGGFVLHRIPTFNGTTVFSAWYSVTGELLESERRDGRKMSRLDSVKARMLGNIWKGN